MVHYPSNSFSGKFFFFLLEIEKKNDLVLLPISNVSNTFSMKCILVVGINENGREIYHFIRKLAFVCFGFDNFSTNIQKTNQKKNKKWKICKSLHNLNTKNLIYSLKFSIEFLIFVSFSSIRGIHTLLFRMKNRIAT